MPAVPVNEYVGLEGKGPIRVEAACATGSAAVYTASISVVSGQADVAIAIGVEKMCEVETATSMAAGGRAGNYLWEFHLFGTSFPAYYALHATAHMAKYGTKEEHLAKVAVKAHKYGVMNPYAHFQREITLEDALKSRVIAWPLKLYDCCPRSDGASFLVLASPKIAKRFTDTPVNIIGSGCHIPLVCQRVVSLRTRKDGGKPRCLNRSQLR